MDMRVNNDGTQVHANDLIPISNVARLWILIDSKMVAIERKISQFIQIIAFKPPFRVGQMIGNGGQVRLLTLKCPTYFIFNSVFILQQFSH